jgi:hypothetical protein
MMIPDPFSKTVVVPVRIRNGRVEFFYGGDLPGLEEGTIGDLVVPAFALRDQALVGPLSNFLDVPVLPAGSVLLAGLRPTAAHPGLLTERGRGRLPLDYGAFGEIELLEPLELRIRGTRKPALKACRCRIPALTGTNGDPAAGMAESVNHAYSQLSAAFEKHRRSHTGNVFEVVFYRSVDAQRQRVWEPLKALRQRLEIRIEQRFRGLAHPPGVPKPVHD